MLTLKLSRYTKEDKEVLKQILTEGYAAVVPLCNGVCESCAYRIPCVDIANALLYLNRCTGSK